MRRFSGSSGRPIARRRLTVAHCPACPAPSPAGSTDRAGSASTTSTPADTQGLEKDEALERIEKLGRELSELENLLTYAGTHGLLVVLQGRDASGKDGTIRKILEFSNIQQSYVQPFKVPTEEERAHDFLWRVHKAVPRRGHVTLFNRSHYEDVLAARVHKIVPESVWKARYAHINAFERLVADADVILLKFYLHISADEQIRAPARPREGPAHGLEAEPGGLARAAAVGRLHRGLRGRARHAARPATRPGTWCPPTRSGSATWRSWSGSSWRCAPTASSGSTRSRSMGKSAMKEIRALRAQIKRSG